MDLIEALIELYSNDSLRFTLWGFLGSGGDMVVALIEAAGFEVWEDYSITYEG